MAGFPEGDPDSKVVSATDDPEWSSQGDFSIDPIQWTLFSGWYRKAFLSTIAAFQCSALLHHSVGVSLVSVYHIAHAAVAVLKDKCAPLWRGLCKRKKKKTDLKDFLIGVTNALITSRRDVSHFHVHYLPLDSFVAA